MKIINNLHLHTFLIFAVATPFAIANSSLPITEMNCNRVETMSNRTVGMIDAYRSNFGLIDEGFSIEFVKPDKCVLSMTGSSQKGVSGFSGPFSADFYVSKDTGNGEIVKYTDGTVGIDFFYLAEYQSGQTGYGVRPTSVTIQNGIVDDFCDSEPDPYECASYNWSEFVKMQGLIHDPENFPATSYIILAHLDELAKNRKSLLLAPFYTYKVGVPKQLKYYKKIQKLYESGEVGYKAYTSCLKNRLLSDRYGAAPQWSAIELCLDGKISGRE